MFSLLCIQFSWLLSLIEIILSSSNIFWQSNFIVVFSGEFFKCEMFPLVFSIFPESSKKFFTKCTNWSNFLLHCLKDEQYFRQAELHALKLREMAVCSNCREFQNLHWLHTLDAYLVFLANPFYFTLFSALLKYNDKIKVVYI